MKTIENYSVAILTLLVIMLSSSFTNAQTAHTAVLELEGAKAQVIDFNYRTNKTSPKEPEKAKCCPVTIYKDADQTQTKHLIINKNPSTSTNNLDCKIDNLLYKSKIKDIKPELKNHTPKKIKTNKSVHIGMYDHSEE